MTPIGPVIGAPRAKLEARYLGQTADDEREAGILAAAPARPRADVVLSGATTTNQLLSDLAALGLDYGDELTHGLATLSEEPAEY